MKTQEKHNYIRLISLLDICCDLLARRLNEVRKGDIEPDGPIVKAALQEYKRLRERIEDKNVVASSHRIISLDLLQRLFHYNLKSIYPSSMLTRRMMYVIKNDPGRWLDLEKEIIEQLSNDEKLREILLDIEALIIKYTPKDDPWS